MRIIGIDVGKRKLDIALLVEGKIRGKVFDNTATGHSALVEWLGKYGVLPQGAHACMEATSTYYEKLAEHLCQHGYVVSVVNPLQIKAYGESLLRRQKTDRADAELIARYCEQHKPPHWQPPQPEVRQLQHLLARLEAIQGMRVQEQNRRHLAEGDARESVERVLNVLDQELAELEKRINDHIDRHPHLRDQRELLYSIPGVGERISAYYLAWLNTGRFDDARQAVAFVGLSPRHRESGSSVHGKPRICKIGNARLRRALYLPAMSAIRCNPAARTLFERLRGAGKLGKVALVAVMRKLIHWMFGVLKSGQPFDVQLALART